MNTRVSVEIDDRQQGCVINARELADLLSAVLSDLSPASEVDAEVGLAFVEPAEMTKLNKEHMDSDGSTDVLAFPMDGIAPGATTIDGPPVAFGDIVICPQVAGASSQPLGDELALLIVHGALHLIGHDHREPDETAEMKQLEVAMLARHHRGVGSHLRQ